MSTSGIAGRTISSSSGSTAPFSRVYFKFKPKGGPTVDIELTRVEPNAAFTDLTRFPRPDARLTRAD